MTSSGNLQPQDLDANVLDAALLESPSPASDTPEHVSAQPSTRVTVERADELVDSHYAEVYRYAYRLIGCRVTAEDIVQETFVQAIRHLDQLRSSHAERAWLLAIARRQFMRVLRKTVHKQHGRMVSIDNPNVDVDRVLTENDNIPPAMQAVDDQDCVQQALSQLGHDARVIIVMHYFEELSYSEIAQQLEIPIGTVMSRLSRSRDQLRKLLDGEAPDGQARPVSQRGRLASPLAPSPLPGTLSQEARHG